MTVTIEAFTAFDGASVGNVLRWHNLTFTSRLGQVGAATLQMDLAENSSELAKVDPRNVLKIRVGSTTLWAGMVDQIVDDTSDEVPTRTVRLVSAEGALGTSDQGGAVVYPYGGLSGRQSDPRRFGPEALEFDDSGWPEPSSGGQPSTEGWPDDRTEVFTGTRRGLFRRVIPGGFEPSTAGRMFMVATSNARVRVYLDGDRVLSKDVGQRGVFTTDVDYDGTGDRVVLIDVDTYNGGPFRVGWCWGEVSGEDEVLTRMMFRTFTEAVYGEPGAGGTIWAGLDNYTTYPGMTPGYIAATLIDEAKDRGAIPWVSAGFDDDDDSAGDPWDLQLAVSWPVGTKLPQALDGMAQYGLDWWLTTNFVLQLAQVRGEDKSTTVELEAASTSKVTTAERATSLLWLTADSMSEVEVEAAAERIEDAITLGTFDAVEAARPAVETLLGVLAEPEVIYDLELTDQSDLPGSFALGDVVGFEGGTVRVISWTCAVSDQDGLPVWSVQAVPEDGTFSRERARRVRDQIRLAFDQTAGGRAGMASPRRLGRSGQGSANVIADGAGNFPATLTVEAHAVPVDGQPVEFTDVVDEGVRRQQLVAWDGPDDEVVWPAGGTVQVYVEGTLDVAVQDGLVEVLLDGDVIWSSSTPDYDEGS